MAGFPYLSPNALEFVNRELTPSGVGIPPSTGNAQVVRGPAIVPGGKTANVTSIFNSRPVNSKDFYKVGGTLSIDGTGTVETGVFSYQVPNGYVAIINRITFQFDPIYPFNTLSSMLTSITLNNSPIPFNDSWSGPQKTPDNPPNLFILADQGWVLTINAVRTSTLSLAARIATSGISYSPNFTADINGTLVLKTASDINFEVASK